MLKVSKKKIFKEKFKKINHVIYAGSLGRYYRNNIKDFNKNSFLKVDNKNFQEMQIKLSIFKKKYKIGLSWKSFSDKFASDKSLHVINCVSLAASGP